MTGSNDTKAPRTAIVVGAGAGGIAIAARLAKAGLSVTVLEKNNFVGGRCSLFTSEAGFRFDQGPSLLLLPNLFRETFADLDTTLEAEGIELLQCFPNYDIWFSDGARFRSSTDTVAMKREIEKWEGPEGFQRYLTWLAEAHGHYEISLRHVLHRNFTNHLQLAEPKFVAPTIALHPLESIWSRTTRYFWSDRLRRVFTFATMYMGMSPFDAPSTYSLLQYTELAEGIWYPKGGFQTVLEAIERIGRRLGVKYRLEAPVAKILTNGTTAKGVQLESGEQLEADLVIVNADLVYAYNNLFPQADENKTVGPQITDYTKDLNKREASCSSISFYWSFSKKIPELGTHNIFLADEYKESFDAIFKRHTLPSDPSFYVNVPSRIDPTAAPEYGDAIIALVPVGHLSPLHPSDGDWPALVAKAKQAVLATVEKRTGCASLADLIIEETVNTPPVWQRKFNLDRGAILGLSHDFFNVLSFRPRTRAVAVENAYFVGASTHPGTGVPIVLAGAKITAEQILGDKKMAVPWTENKFWRGKVQETGDPTLAVKKHPKLDKIRAPLWVDDWQLFLGAIILALVAMVLHLSGTITGGVTSGSRAYYG
ncbi:Phytoene desaturase protein [Podospora australis]|uniref:Phytoene desaturase n=1 Tax=Podospora australis TaxID=1536484 RepID=A0AAN6WY81_9PEZI|nr:Phytoene desaturase protein [Podospora australis]